MSFLKFISYFALTILFHNAIQAQDWVRYQSQQQVNDLVDTGNELHLATDAGLVVMNKSTLEKSFFNKANSSLSNNHIQTITQSIDGITYIGTYDVILARFDGTDFQDITTPDHPAYYPNSTELYDFKIAPNGDFWLGTNHGVFHREGSTWSHYDETILGDGFFEAWDIEINDDGEVFMASNDVFKFADGVWSNISDNTNLLGYLDADLFFNTDGNLYFSGDLDKIGRYDGTQWEEYEFEFDINGSHVVRFTEDTDGSIYLNTLLSGIFKLENNIWIQQTDAQATAFDNETDFFYIDEQGNRWMNSDIYLSVDKNGTIESTLISSTTLDINLIDNLHKGSNGSMYFLTALQTISVLATDGTWSFLPLPSALMPFETLNDLLLLSENDIWLAGGNGLYHYNGIEWTTQLQEGCRSFALDAQGKIYLRSTSKIFIIDDGLISEYNVNNSPLSTLIISGHGVDLDDNLWISSFDWDGNNAIQKVATDGTWTTYDGADYPVFNRLIGDIYTDHEGNVWIPEDVVGAIKFDGENFTNPIQENIGQIDVGSVHSIKSDAAGKLYFSHERGVTTLLNDEWDNLIIADIPSSIYQNSNIEFDDEGTLWWASKREGVFSYSPESTTSISPVVELDFDFSIFPNPAQNHTVLEFATEENADVKTFIYNQLGQLQSSLDLGQSTVGTFQQRINLTDFPNGVYIIQLQINDVFSTKKITVQ